VRSVRDTGIELARSTSRRSFLGVLGRAVVAIAGGGMVAAALDPERASATHICGHYAYTGSCPHPFFPHTRIDRYGYPLHPLYGHAVDDAGEVYRSRTQKRSRICEDLVTARYPYTAPTTLEGTWSRCCGGRVRRIVDCCSRSRTRINGDASLVGYCLSGRRVFCITYRETDVAC
jgi:hypothetical protein